MNKDTIIGFVLIAVVLIGFSWYNQPSAEEIEAARKQDSIAAAIKDNAAKQQKLNEAARKAQAESAAKKNLTKPPVRRRQNLPPKPTLRHSSSQHSPAPTSLWY